MVSDYVGELCGMRRIGANDEKCWREVVESVKRVEGVDLGERGMKEVAVGKGRMVLRGGVWG